MTTTLAPTPLIDLHSLIEQHAPTRLTHMSTSGGGEYAGPCPWCQGTDRFRVWPHSVRPHYWCRKCYKSGDAIQFVREWLELPFNEACFQLGLDPWDVSDFKQTEYQRTAEDPPSLEWQSQGGSVLYVAKKFLWSERGKEALGYLRGRGLSDETIKKAQLGYIPPQENGRWFQDTFEKWGLLPDTLSPSQLEKGCVRIPDGILIPWFEGDVLWKLAVKRPGQKMDYGQIMGSAEGLYNVDSLHPGHPSMMVEGELDALSVQQCAGDIIGVVGTGSATRGRLGRWIADFMLCNYVLQSYDDDPAGNEGSLFWTEKLPHALRWAPYDGKDPNEMLQNGGTEVVCRWVEWGLNEVMPERTRPPEQPSPTHFYPLARVQPACNCVVKLSFPPHAVKPHEPKKTKYRDVRGNNWCDDCYWQCQLIDLGEQLGYPRLLSVPSGYEAYFDCAQNGGTVRVEDCVRQVRSLLGLSMTSSHVQDMVQDSEEEFEAALEVAF